MYQNTCHILPWLTQFSSPEIAASLSEHFDVVPAVTAVSFAGVGGLERLGTVRFGPRLNLVAGELGKTRTLETIRQQAGDAPPLPHQTLRVLREQSNGQILSAVLFMLLEIQPKGSALLVDDVLDSVDAATARELLGLLAHHDKQVVMTVRPHMVEMVRQSLAGSDVMYVDLDGAGSRSP